jgi:uncharacterized protein (TIGR03067 family)
MRTGLLIVTLILAADPPTDGAKMELEKLQGEWTVSSEVAGGNEVPPDKLKGRSLEVKGEKYLFKSPVTGGEPGTLAIGLGKKFRTIDLTPADGPNKGKVRHGIYEISGAMLKICYKPIGEDRPMDFTSERGSTSVLVVYRRAKS